jgi:predicted permease
MKALNRFLARLLNLAARSANNREADKRLREEMQEHLALQVEENLHTGMTPGEAQRQARLKFGAAEAVRENYHAENSLPFLENLLMDVRYAFRVLRKSPAFTIVALITLMLGIGANVVVFGVLNTVLLHPIDGCDSQNLYQLRHRQWTQGKLLTTSYPAFEDLRRRNTTLSEMAAYESYSTGALSWRNTVLDVHGDEVTGNYFDLLRVQPEAGRLFHEAEEHGPNSVPYLVLSDKLWRSAFHADPSIVGATVELNKNPFTVIGVATQKFHGIERFGWPDYWMPMANEAQVDASDYLRNRASVAVTVLARLKPDVTPQQATENLNAISAELAREYPETDDGLPLRLIHPGLLGDDGDVIRGFLWSVAVLALLVLAAACANLATLFAARTADRTRELALRLALGSSRRRLVRQLLTEALIVSLLGGAAGLAGAYLLLGVLTRWDSPYGHLEISVDARVYLAGLALTVTSALLFGMIPARQALQSSPMQSIKNGQSESMHLRHFALRDLLLGVQIAICTLLVTASLVAARGMERQLQAPLGFEPRGAMLADLDLGSTQWASDLSPVQQQAKLQQLQQAVIDALRSIPGITAVGAVNRTPMTGGLHGVPVFQPGTTEFKLKNAALSPYVFQISPGYLEAARTPLLGGRDINWHDTATTPHVSIVNQTFAHKMWNQTPAIGQRFLLYGNLTEVVGIAEDGKYHDMHESPQPVVYLPFSQSEGSEAIFVIRSPRPPSETAAALQRALSGIAPELPISIQSWPDSIQAELFPARAATAALGVMGLLAAMLAVTGIFGMAAYSVSRRMKELGIRMALGARKTQVMSAAIGRPIILLGIGSAAGLVSGVLAGRLLGHMVYQANPRDPIVIVGAVLTMALLGIAASAIPARRALAVDPSNLMREE